MAIIPLKQVVEITPALLDEDGNPITDEWDRPMTGPPYTIKCSVNEGMKLVRSQVPGAQEVVSSARIFFDKKANISMLDVIKFIDELGNARTYTPISIEAKRLNGRRILTVVNV